MCNHTYIYHLWNKLGWFQYTLNLVGAVPELLENVWGPYIQIAYLYTLFLMITNPTTNPLNTSENSRWRTSDIGHLYNPTHPFNWQSKCIMHPLNPKNLCQNPNQLHQEVGISGGTNLLLSNLIFPLVFPPSSSGMITSWKPHQGTPLVYYHSSGFTSTISFGPN